MLWFHFTRGEVLVMILDLRICALPATYIATQKNEAKLVKRVKTCHNMSKPWGLRPSCNDMWFVLFAPSCCS